MLVARHYTPASAASPSPIGISPFAATMFNSNFSFSAPSRPSSHHHHHHSQPRHYSPSSPSPSSMTPPASSKPSSSYHDDDEDALPTLPFATLTLTPPASPPASKQMFLSSSSVAAAAAAATTADDVRSKRQQFARMQCQEEMQRAVAELAKRTRKGSMQVHHRPEKRPQGVRKRSLGALRARQGKQEKDGERRESM